MPLCSQPSGTSQIQKRYHQQITHLMTGRTLAISSSRDTVGAPGLVDWPPTSMMSAPSCTRASAFVTAAASVVASPPSLKLSGVVFRMPITQLRCCQAHSPLP